MKVEHRHASKSLPRWAVGHSCPPGRRLGLPSLKASFCPLDRAGPQPYLYTEPHALVRAARPGPSDPLLGTWNRSGQSLLPVGTEDTSIHAERLSLWEHFVGWGRSEGGRLRQGARGGAEACVALERRLSWPGSSQATPASCFQNLLPGPGEAGPHVPPSGSGKGRCIPAVEDLSSSDPAHAGFRFLGPQERCLSATLSLWVGSLVTQADGGSTAASHPGAWLGARPPRRCCRPGQPRTPAPRSYVLVLTGTAPGLHSSKHPRGQRALSEGHRPGHRPTSLGSHDQTEGTRDAGGPDISPLCDKDPGSATDGRLRVKMIKHFCVARPGSSPTTQRAGGTGSSFRASS